MLADLALMSRRGMLRTAMATAVAAGMAGCAKIVPQSVGLALTPNPLTDPPVFNFALNLEYLEAEYYGRGVFGQGLPMDLVGPEPGPVTGGRQVPFRSRYLREFMAEIAEDEREHVRFIRQTIAGTPLIELSRPAIDLAGAFRAVGQAAGLGGNFNPFADEESFLLGAFLFEDVGVSAYAGAARRVAGADSITAAAGILAVEAYHAGIIRAQIAEMGPATIAKANAISAARNKLDGPRDTETRLEPNRIHISNTDPQGRAYTRGVNEVLNVVYATPGDDVKSGGFFPNGFKGVVDHTLNDTHRKEALA